MMGDFDEPEGAREERLRLALESTGQGVWDWDLERSELYTSPRCLQMLGWTEDALPSEIDAWTNLVSPEEREEGREELLAHLRGHTERFEREFPMRCDDGRRRWVLVRGRAVAHDGAGRVRRMVGTMCDVTERRMVVEGLQRAVAAAEAANEAKSESLASMSHEIRTPMNGIVGMMELALNTSLTREQREYLQTARSSIDALLRIVNDVLDFSKIEAGRIVLERTEFSVRECVEEACRALSLAAHQRGLELTFLVEPSVPERLEGDPGRLRQVLLNLMANAIKFTENGEVSLGVSLLGGQGDEAHVAFAVRDTGAGISPEKQVAVFEAFAQADASITRRFGGTGLGLTIASRLATMMGGGITLLSAPDAGSTFTLSARFDVAPARRVFEAPEALRGVRVLAVDDNATNRQIYQQALAQWSCDGVVAVSGEEALALVDVAEAEGRPFSLLIIDEEMPGMDGPSVAAALRTKSAKPTIVMAVSAPAALDPERMEALDVWRRVIKPLSPAVLLEAVREWHPDSQRPPPDLDPAAAQPGLLDRLRTSRPLRVLVTEDHRVNQIVAARVMERLGHSVVLARNGRECVEVWERGNIDAILMDIQMPVMDGIEATRAIREIERVRGTHTPIIALTAHAMTGDRERCLAAGMDGYMSKPIQIEEVAAALEAVSDPSRPPSLPPAPLDESALMTSLDGDVDLALQLAGMFLEESDELLKNMWASWRRGDLAGLRIAVHGLKGALANFGLGSAFERARLLDLSIRGGDLAGVAEEGLVDLERETRGVAKALRSFVRKVGASEPPPPLAGGSGDGT